MKRKLGLAAFFAAASLAAAGPARAIPITFTGSSGNLAAQVDFDVSGSLLIVTLTNTSTADVLVPIDNSAGHPGGGILTAVFFDIAGNPALSRISAVVATGSSVLFGSTDPGNVVGGEMAYNTGLSGAPGSTGLGISSVGLGLFGPSNLFPGNNLQGPTSPDGLQYGLTSAGDNSSTGNTPVTGTNALIQNSVVYTLGGLPSGFQLSSISNVQFQYGTDLTDTSIPGGSTGGGTAPVPSTLLLLGTGLAAVGALRRR